MYSSCLTSPSYIISTASWHIHRLKKMIFVRLVSEKISFTTWYMISSKVIFVICYCHQTHDTSLPADRQKCSQTKGLWHHEKMCQFSGSLVFLPKTHSKVRALAKSQFWDSSLDFERQGRIHFRISWKTDSAKMSTKQEHVTISKFMNTIAKQDFSFKILNSQLKNVRSTTKFADSLQMQVETD